MVPGKHSILFVNEAALVTHFMQVSFGDEKHNGGVEFVA
jgi:hypothetical protein